MFDNMSINKDNTSSKDTVADPKKQKALYNLHGGVKELPDGTLERSKMFEVFSVPLDDYSDVKLTYEELKRVRWHGLMLKYGFTAMTPIYCLGPVKCPFNTECPFVDKTIRCKDNPDAVDYAGQNIKKFPLARRCPIEAEMLAWKIQGYADEYNVDVESPTEMGMICKLAEIDVYDYRCTRVLAAGDKEGEGMNLLKEQVIGTSAQGHAIKRLEEHPAFTLKEKLNKERMEILTALVGTRKEKYKKQAALKEASDKDISLKQSSLMKRLQTLSTSSDIVDGEFTEVEPELADDN